MKNDLEKSLDYLTEQIKLYRQTDIMDGEGLVQLLQQITATLYYLENERSKFHDEFQRIINSLVLDGNSVSRAENEAHVQIPQMYKLRHVMQCSYEIVGAIRTQIS